MTDKPYIFSNVFLSSSLYAKAKSPDLVLLEVTWRGQWPCEGIIYLDSKRQDQLRERVRRKERKRAYMSKVWLYGNNVELIVSANHSKAKRLWSLVVFFHKASVPRCLHMSSSLLFLCALIKSYDCVITMQGHGYQGLLLWHLKQCILIQSLVTQMHVSADRWPVHVSTLCWELWSWRYGTTASRCFVSIILHTNILCASRCTCHKHVTMSSLSMH